MTVQDCSKQPERNARGQFVKGVSGNPLGRPVGSKNYLTEMKRKINEALVEDMAEDIMEIIAVAVKKAKNGDNAMIKFLLGDLIKENGEQDTDTGDITIKVTNMTVNSTPGDDAIVIEQED